MWIVSKFPTLQFLDFFLRNASREKPIQSYDSPAATFHPPCERMYLCLGCVLFRCVSCFLKISLKNGCTLCDWIQFVYLDTFCVTGCVSVIGYVSCDWMRFVLLDTLWIWEKWNSFENGYASTTRMFSCWCYTHPHNWSCGISSMLYLEPWYRQYIVHFFILSRSVLFSLTARWTAALFCSAGLCCESGMEVALQQRKVWKSSGSRFTAAEVTGSCFAAAE